MISRALLNAPFFTPKDADLLRNRKVNTKKRQNRHLSELAFLILGTYFTAPFFLSGILLEFRMFFCIIEEESTQDNTQVVEDGKTCMNRRLQLQIV